MVDKLVKQLGNELPKLIEEADTFFKEQKFLEAQSAYENLIALDYRKYKNYIWLIKMFG